MEVIANHLSIVLNHLETYKSISLGLSEQGIWNVADDDTEIAALVVMRFMLKHNHKSIGQLHILENGINYTLYSMSGNYKSKIG